jgi:hypothetical protein
MQNAKLKMQKAALLKLQLKLSRTDLDRSACFRLKYRPKGFLHFAFLILHFYVNSDLEKTYKSI